MGLTKPLLAVLSLTAFATSHGIITNPPSRRPGPATEAVCGKSLVDIIHKDNQTQLEVLHAATSRDKDFQPDLCDLVVCKGFQLEDNLDNIQHFRPGQVVRMQGRTRIPHRGWASVAIVDAKTWFVIGEPLLTFTTDSVTGLAAGEGHKHDELAAMLLEEDEQNAEHFDMDFEVKLPTDLGDRCSVPGDCVLEWTWFGRIVHHIYESCIDFSMSGEIDEADERAKPRPLTIQPRSKE